MLKKLLYLPFLFLGYLPVAQVCPAITSPANGATNVPVTSSITWTPVTGVPGYRISIGTTPGGTEIIANQPVGSATSYTPPLGLPENTQLYVTLTLFFFNQEDIVCASQTFRTEDVVTPPPCAVLASPAPNATNVNGGTNIRWNYAPTATGYRLRIGTNPGVGDFLPETDLGNVLVYNPPVDLPPSTPIFVLLIPYNENGVALNCQETNFTTGALATLPSCATMVSPVDGALNVPLTPFLEWTEVPGALSYRVSIGSSPFEQDVLNNAIFFTNSTFVLDFEPNRTFYITIIPQNGAGEALGCGQESFSTLFGCGPFFNPDGELIDLSPVIDFPDQISFCQNETPYTITTTDNTDGFRWYRINSNGSETLLSETPELTLTETGNYRYEAYNTIAQTGGTFECSSSQEFTVVSSEIATITALDLINQDNGLQITVRTTGIGAYEYALNNVDGPYQDSPVFDGVLPGTHTVYVRDKNGCGISQDTIVQDLTLEGFPKFFTPNNDGINDFWQFISPSESDAIIIVDIKIYNRYGLLIAQIDPDSPGWDGTFRGKPMPASDYWFDAVDLNNREIKGHFSLMR